MRVMKDLVGYTLSGRYRMVTRIAGGGMGEVYRAHDLLLDRPVAVKVLQPTLASDPDLVARFRDEARAAARLNHPNVVAVHDWGSEDDKTYFMVMEYVAGTDLRDVLVGRGPLDVARATEVTIALCDALDAAHRQGLVHRDVKPENLLISRDGTVKVADFGIAAIADAERTLPGGNIVGTLRYLAPEQARGEEATAASDVWAAGALLFEFLLGQPLPGGTGAELLKRRAVEPPIAPSAIEPSIPEALDAVVLKACALDPSDRYSSAAEMASDLRDVHATLEVPARPVDELLNNVTQEIRLPAVVSTTAVPATTKVRARDRRRAARRRPRFAFLAIALVLLLLGGWRTSVALFGPKEVEVPRLVGATLDQAEARAEASGFDVEVVDEKRDPSIEAGGVIEQKPAGGLLLEGETIELVVSKGPPLTLVPKLEGEPWTEGRKKLRRNNLQVGEVTRRYSVEHDRGIVISQDPARKAGRVEWGTTVDVVVSRGPRSIDVPTVTGLDAEDAERLVREAGFQPVLVEVFHDDVKKGKVVSTSPSGGSSAPEASEVQIYVSKGKDKSAFRLPDMRGEDVGRAREKLEDRGLKVVVQRSCPGRTVRATDPMPGERVREGDTVRLYVCG